MNTSVLLLLAAFGQLSTAPAARSPGEEPTFSASIRAENDIRIFAEVEGLLTQLTVREGARVTDGDLLATIDDRQAQAAVDVADISFHAADERANDKVEEQYAILAAAVARKDYEMGLQANSGGQKVISPIELEKKKLDWQRATLQTEKARKDQRLARLEADVKQAELKASKIALERRTILAPFDGEVQLLFLRQDEWVRPGDPILRLVQFDVMHVECLVPSAEFDPADLHNRRVTVHIELARDRQESVPGRVIYINQTVFEGAATKGMYLVRAEVENRRVGDFWLVRPGLKASITIHTSQPPVDAPPASAALESR